MFDTSLPAQIQEEPLVQLSHVFVEFDQLQVLRDVSVDIYRGEFVVLHGDTGCGKSTVLRLIAGLLNPTRGAVRVAGEDVQEFSTLQRRWLRRAIGLMLQNSPLLEDRTILENVMLPVLIKLDNKHWQPFLAAICPIGLKTIRSIYLLAKDNRSALRELWLISLF